VKFVFFALALLVSSTCAALEVADIASMDRTSAMAHERGCITGVVSLVYHWQDDSAIVVSAADPNGPAIYVCGNLPERTLVKPTYENCDGLHDGDILEITGCVTPLMLQPGFEPAKFRKIGSMVLPIPTKRRVADLKTGLLDNRRSRIEGVCRSVSSLVYENHKIWALSLATEDGPITAMVRGMFEPKESLRDALIEVSGVAVGVFNERSEMIDAMFLSFGGWAVRTVVSAPSDPFAVPEVVQAGISTWTPGRGDLHARKVSGIVTYADPTGRWFVLQTPVAAVTVRPGIPFRPDLGLHVEAAGFPVLIDNCGELEYAMCRISDESPEMIPPVSIRSVEAKCHNQLVRIRGRLVGGVDFTDGRTRFAMLFDGRRVEVELASELPRSLAGRFAYGPVLEVTGVMKVELESFSSRGQFLSPVGARILLREPSDVRILPDAAYRNRRAVRLVMLAGLCSLVPLLAVLVFVMVRQSRQKALAAAVGADRRRMAAELHDGIAQHLAGARMLLYSLKRDAENLPESSRGALAMAEEVIEKAKIEVRDAILDLQSDDLMTKDTETLLKELALKRGSVGGVRVRIRLRGMDVPLGTSEKRDLLVIVQEAISNAIRHGKATNILVVSDPIIPGGFALGVLNDGTAFDADTALGPETGHFGLSSMRERALRSGFVLTFGERSGFTEVRIERKTT
jgi:signal transduction histidine kinase